MSGTLIPTYDPLGSNAYIKYFSTYVCVGDGSGKGGDLIKALGVRVR